jgi:hypothetical protein
MSTDRDRDLDRIFTYHPPKGDQAARYELIRTSAKIFAEILVNSAPESRERERAITHIECAVFWANASIARNE